MPTKFSYRKDAWTPRISGYNTYNDAAKAFKDEFYYSPNHPSCKELVRIVKDNNIDPNNITAVKDLFASFTVQSYQE